MSYVIDFKMDNLVAANTVLSEWVSNTTYADLNGLFPEISEADWPTIRASISDMVALPRAEVGVTPGVLDYSQSVNEYGAHIVITFDSKDSYDNYELSHRRVINYGLVLYFPESDNFVVKDYITLDGRNIIDTRPGFSVTNTPIGLWLVRTYQLYRQSIITCTHTET
jgi:hypothetical protein